MVGRKRDGSEPAQVRHSRGRGAGGVECRGERLVWLGSCGGRFSVCVRVRTRVGLQPHTPRNRKYYEELDQRDIGTKSKNWYTDRETAFIATFRAHANLSGHALTGQKHRATGRIRIARLR